MAPSGCLLPCLSPDFPSPTAAPHNGQVEFQNRNRTHHWSSSSVCPKPSTGFSIPLRISLKSFLCSPVKVLCSSNGTRAGWPLLPYLSHPLSSSLTLLLFSKDIKAHSFLRGLVPVDTSVWHTDFSILHVTDHLQHSKAQRIGQEFSLITWAKVTHCLLSLFRGIH